MFMHSIPLYCDSPKYFFIMPQDLSQWLELPLSRTDCPKAVRAIYEGHPINSRINIPISIDRTSLFQMLGVLGGIFHFYSNLNRTFCKQTVVTLIRRHILWRLIWVCTGCQCPTKRTLGLYGLNPSKTPLSYPQ